MAALVPWFLTGSESNEVWATIRMTSALLLAAGGIVLVSAFVRFVVEGLGTPAPVAPTEQLVVGRFFRSCATRCISPSPDDRRAGAVSASRAARLGGDLPRHRRNLRAPLRGTGPRERYGARSRPAPPPYQAGRRACAAEEAGGGASLCEMQRRKGSNVTDVLLLGRRPRSRRTATDASAYTSLRRPVLLRPDDGAQRPARGPLRLFRPLRYRAPTNNRSAEHVVGSSPARSSSLADSTGERAEARPADRRRAGDRRLRSAHAPVRAWSCSWPPCWLPAAAATASRTITAQDRAECE